MTPENPFVIRAPPTLFRRFGSHFYIVMADIQAKAAAKMQGAIASEFHYERSGRRLALVGVKFLAHLFLFPRGHANRHDGPNNFENGVSVLLYFPLRVRVAPKR